MSSMEKHIGKLREVQTDGKTIEEYFTLYCKEKGLEPNKYQKSYTQVARELEDDKLFVVGDKIYEMIEHEELDECEDLNIFTRNTDGTISFITEFYNGGACLSEIIEDNLMAK